MTLLNGRENGIVIINNLELPVNGLKRYIVLYFNTSVAFLILNEI